MSCPTFWGQYISGIFYLADEKDNYFLGKSIKVGRPLYRLMVSALFILELRF